MTRYYTNFDHLYDSANGYRSNGISGSGWQSSMNNGSISSASSSSLTRLVVDSPFGRKKCDYTIEKAQPGRLIVTARRRGGFASLKKAEEAKQIFSIPFDADVQRLRSYIEPLTHRLIIEIPRLISTSTSNYAYQPRSTRPNEYRIDCQGYSPNDLDIYLQGQDFIVQGRSSRGSASKRFSKKITLPSNIDLTRVNSYYDNGQIRIQAPYKSHFRSATPSTYYRRHMRHRTTSSKGMRRVRSMGELNADDDYDYEEMPDDRRRLMTKREPSMIYRRYSLDEDDDDDDQRSFQF